MARRRKTEEQMDLLEEGGLKDEGGTVDPVSGNDVPPGSTQEEVRDDIPAQLSEGEFVFPADVVRYIGLENLMELRQKAKMGLQKMEDMGQMGNSEEAIMSDNGEFEDTIDKTIEALPMAMGGMVPASAQPLGAQVLGPPAGNTMPGQQAPTPTTTAFQMQPSTAMNQTTNPFLKNPNIAMAQGGMVPNTMKPKRSPFKRPTQNFQIGGAPQPVPTVTPPAQVPTYAQFMGQSPAGQGPASPVVYGTEQYIGPNGDIIGITTINNQPVENVPDGYKKYNPATDTPAAPVVAKPEVKKTGGDGMEGRAQDEASKREYASSLTEMKELSELSPSYRAFVEENLPNQYKAAQAMTIDPETGLPSFPGVSFGESMKAVLSKGEMLTELKEGLSGLFGENTEEKTYQEIAKVYGLDVADYQTKGLFGSSLDTESLRRDAMVANAVAKSMPGLEREKIKDVIARTQFERDDDGRIDRDSLVDRNTGELTQTGKELFGQTLSDEEEAELEAEFFAFDSGDNRDNGDGFDARDTGDYDPGGMASEGKGDTKDYSKGGAVKPKRKKGLGRLK